MIVKFQPSVGLGAVARIVLCLHLAFFLTSCGGTAPKLSAEQRALLQTRTLSAPYATAFEAGVLSLKDLGYEIDLVDAQAGLISGVKTTDSEIAKIEDDDGIPTWAWIVGAVFIVVVVVVVVAVAIAGGGDDDDDKKKAKEKQAKSGGAIVVQNKDRNEWAGTAGVRDPGGNTTGKGASLAGATPDSSGTGREAGVRDPGGNVDGKAPSFASTQSNDGGKTRQLVATGDLPEKQSHKTRVRASDPEKIKRRHTVTTEDHEAWYFVDAVDLLDFVLAPEVAPDKPWYHYRLTLNLDDSSDTNTNVFVAINGSKLDGNELEKSGPVLDPVMHRQLFAAMDRFMTVVNNSTQNEGK